MTWCITLDFANKEHSQFYEDAVSQHMEVCTIFAHGQEWRLQGYSEDAPDQPSIIAACALQAQIVGTVQPRVKFEKLPTLNWLANNQNSFPPLQIGQFYVYGSHIKSKLPANTINLCIDAATAFGTGEHETTAGCLLGLEYLSAEHEFVNPLDLGTGTGILAMAIAKLWDVPVVAVDNDPQAIEVARKNCKINALQDTVHCRVGDGVFSVASQGPFDLITANILANPLCEMAPDMHKNLCSNGWIILSGILQGQDTKVIKSYEEINFLLKNQQFYGDWSVLILQKI